MATKTAKRYIPTQAYFDGTAATLTIVSPNGTTVASTSVPETIATADRTQQETWTRETVRTLGHRTRGRVREYPWGFMFNV